MTMTKSAALNYVVAMLDALLSAVEAAGDKGIPGGHLYAFIMGGEPSMTAAQFNGWMEILIKAGRVIKRGEVYFAVKV